MNAIKVRVTKWDNTKAILIFLVVLGHALTSFLKQDEVIRSLFLWITAFHMPLFMFVTGLFSKSFVKAPKFNSQKIASYVLLYFFMKLLIHITMLSLRGRGSFRWISESGTPWYIFVTAVFMVLTYLLKSFNPKKVLAVAVLASLTVGYINEIGDTFMLSRIFVYYPYFFLGYMLDREKLLEITQKWWIKLSSAVILVGFTIAVFSLGDNIYSLRYVMTGNNAYSEFGADWAPFGLLLRIGCYTLSSLVSFAFLSIIPNRNLAVISKIGAKTLNVYALHRPVLYILQYTVMTPFMKGMAPWLIILLLFSGSAVITFLLSLKPFDYILWPCTNCHKWFAPIKKWLQK